MSVFGAWPATPSTQNTRHSVTEPHLNSSSNSMVFDTMGPGVPRGSAASPAAVSMWERF